MSPEAPRYSRGSRRVHSPTSPYVLQSPFPGGCFVFQDVTIRRLAILQLSRPDFAQSFSYVLCYQSHLSGLFAYESSVLSNVAVILSDIALLRS